MGMYRVYNENYDGEWGQDLSSVDFVEVDNYVINCPNLYDKSIKKHLNIVNVKVEDVPRFVKQNTILSPFQVMKMREGSEENTYMQPYQYKHQMMREELLEDTRDDMACSNDEFLNACDKFFNMLQDAEKYCPTAIKANAKYEKDIAEQWQKVPEYRGYTGETAVQPRRICGYLSENDVIDRETLNTSISNDYCTSGICISPSTFDDSPRDFSIDADSIFTSNKKSEDTIDVSNLDSISIDNSSLMQGSCIDMFNQTVEKIGDAKIREPEHTSPAKIEKQRRIEEYHKRHNRKKNR